jgi:hypothetical protein
MLGVIYSFSKDGSHSQHTRRILDEVLDDFDDWMDDVIFEQVQYFAYDNEIISYLSEEHDIYIRPTGWEFYSCRKSDDSEEVGAD